MAKYELNVVSFVANSITELAVRPPTRHLETVATVTGISLDAGDQYSLDLWYIISLKAFTFEVIALR